MTAIVGLLCCCDGGPIDCENQPSSVVVTWNGSIEVTWTPCTCFAPFSSHPQGFGYTPQSLSFVASRVFGCAYVGTDLATTPTQTCDQYNCSLNQVVGSQEFIVYADIGPPTQSLSGYWEVGVTITGPGANEAFGVCGGGEFDSAGPGLSGSIIYRGGPVTGSVLGVYSALQPSWHQGKTIPSYLTVITDNVGSVTVS